MNGLRDWLAGIAIALICTTLISAMQAVDEKDSATAAHHEARNDK